MKKFIFLLLLCLCVPGYSVAQSNVSLVDTATCQRPLLHILRGVETHMNMLFNTGLVADISQNGFTQMTARMNYLKWELKGKIDDDFSFHFRQSLTKSALSATTDKAVLSVDYANLSWMVNRKFSLTFGKQLLCLGGYEFWMSGYKVKEFSLFNDYMNNYGTGFTAQLRLNDCRSLSFQVVNSKTGDDDETFCYGRPEGIEASKIPLLATVNYERFSPSREWQLRYSFSLGQQAARHGMFYFTSGHVLRRNALLAYLDINFSYEGIDHKGLVSQTPVIIDKTPVTARHAYYFSTIFNVDYRFSPHWNVFLKGIYEQGGVASRNAYYMRGTYFHEWQAQLCAEFYPKPKLDLKFYLLTQCRQRYINHRVIENNADNWNRQRLVCGVVYAIPVF